MIRPSLSSTWSWNPIKIGLTGSIGMGKSTISKQFRYLGFPVFDADETVHRLYAKGGGAVQPIQGLFPDAVVDGAIDRAILSRLVLSDAAALTRLESIIHPLVSQERLQFLECAAKKQNFIVVYDIPLLMKHPEKHNVDYSIVVTASSETQRERVMSRPGMTMEKFQSILEKQVPDNIQRERADYVINTDFVGYDEAKSQLAHILNDIIEKNNEKWETWSHLPPYLSAEKVVEEKSDNSLILGQDQRSTEKKLKQIFDLIIFDVDNTIYPEMGPLMEAHHAQIKFLSTMLSEANIDFLRNNLSQEIRRIETNYPLIAHNRPEVRSRALYDLLQQWNALQYHSTAMQIYNTTRDDIIHHLYDDVIPCFQWLVHDQQVPIALLSNSNVNIPFGHSSPATNGDDEDNGDGVGVGGINSQHELTSLLSLVVNSTSLGGTKPSPLAYLTMIQKMNVHPSRVLFIGDSYDCDVIGPAKLGMRTGHLCRHIFNEDKLNNQQYPSHIRPDFMLKSLEIQEIREKLVQTFLSH